jgi:hypothetical protein
MRKMFDAVPPPGARRSSIWLVDIVPLITYYAAAPPRTPVCVAAKEPNDSGVGTSG